MAGRPARKITAEKFVTVMGVLNGFYGRPRLTLGAPICTAAVDADADDPLLPDDPFAANPAATAAATAAIPPRPIHNHL